MTVTTNIRILLMAATVILLAISGFGIARSLTPVITTETIKLYDYSMSVSGNYKAQLVENELYPEGFLGEDRLYSISLVDHLEITFTADYSGSRAAAVSGDYSVSVIVQGHNSAGDRRNVIYEREYPVIKDTPIRGDNGAQISDTISLDLNVYKEFSDQAEHILKSKQGREAIVVFSGIFLAQGEYGKVEEPFSYSIYIPLSNDLFSITKDPPISKADSISQTNEVTAKRAPTGIVLSASGALIAFVAILILIFMARPPAGEALYALGFKAILRKHGSRMVKLGSLPHIPGNQRIPVANLDSLVKISDDRQQFICYFPAENGLPAQDLLYVPDGERYYTLNWKE